jgi:hypothetical protein
MCSCVRGFSDHEMIKAALKDNPTVSEDVIREAVLGEAVLREAVLREAVLGEAAPREPIFEEENGPETESLLKVRTGLVLCLI